MGSSNDGLEKIQRLNEHNRMPMTLIGGRMKVFTTVSHISKPSWSSNSSRDGKDAVWLGKNEDKLVVSVVKVEVKFDMILESFFEIIF